MASFAHFEELSGMKVVYYDEVSKIITRNAHNKYVYDSNSACDISSKIST